MFFQKNASEKGEIMGKFSIKKMDALITGVILGGVIGSIYGIKKLKDIHDNKASDQTHLFEDKLSEKRGFWARIFGKR